MRRFITYIYEYEQGNRGRNTGFIRTDLRENSCRMELQIRGFDRFKGKCPVYLTVYENGLQAIPVTELLLTQGMGTCSFTCENNRIGNSGFDVHQAQTLTIACGNGRFLTGCLSSTPVPLAVFLYENEDHTFKVSFRVNGAFDAASLAMHFGEALRGEFLIFQKKEAVPPAAQAQTEPVIQTQSTTEPERFRQPQAMPEPVPVRQSQAMPEPEPIRQPETTPQPETIQQPKTIPQPEAARQPQTSYQKVEIQDIRKLPKSNWNLCNNRFLLHGFFNYHYLMLKTLEMNGEKRQFLGIPGIYEQPERMMAMLFGFPEFEAAAAVSSDSKDMTGVFGYWMCPLNQD